MPDPFGDRRDPLVKAMDRAATERRMSEVTRLRCALADIEALATTLGEAKKIASDALQFHSQR